MKGVILAGGRGVRLYPLTKVVTKALLNVYNKPLIMYPLQTLIDAGLDDILIVVSADYLRDFNNLLGDGKELGIKISYKAQTNPRGMADAVMCARRFVGKDNAVVIAADNIYEQNFHQVVSKFKSGCQIFLNKVPDPERYGVLELDAQNRPVEIIEKPKNFVSNYAVTAIYIFDHRVFSIADKLKPSERGEFEIVDLINWYLRRGELDYEHIKGKFIDAGTFDSLLEANVFIAEREKLKSKLS